ncbi:MAG: hypothetical protein QOJ12_2277 [Thermoleophilales bacterium]|nr:hypothetical protein [Thermoleophilales bacterium]
MACSRYCRAMPKNNERGALSGFDLILILVMAFLLLGISLLIAFS